MKSKKMNKVLHIVMTNDSRKWLCPLEKGCETMRAMTPAIEAGGCNIKGLPGWAITILAHNGYAIIQTHLGSDTLVATTYVVWSRRGSDPAWRAATAAHQEVMSPFLGKFADASHMPMKPCARKWIAVVLQHRERHDEIIPQIPRVGAILNDLALCAIEYYGSLGLNGREHDPDSKEYNAVIRIFNEGARIVATDYFGSEWERAGKFLLTCMNGVIRLLWPSSRIATVQQMMLAKEVIVTKGIHDGQEALEVLFDDHSAAPYMLLMTASSVVGFFPGDPGDKQWMFAIWTWVNGGPSMVFCKTAHWRQGTTLPDLRPLEQPTQDK